MVISIVSVRSVREECELSREYFPGLLPVTSFTGFAALRGRAGLTLRFPVILPECPYTSFRFPDRYPESAKYAVVIYQGRGGISQSYLNDVL